MESLDPRDVLRKALAAQLPVEPPPPPAIDFEALDAMREGAARKATRRATTRARRKAMATATAKAMPAALKRHAMKPPRLQQLAANFRDALGRVDNDISDALIGLALDVARQLVQDRRARSGRAAAGRARTAHRRAAAIRRALPAAEPGRRRAGGNHLAANSKPPAGRCAPTRRSHAAAASPAPQAARSTPACHALAARDQGAGPQRSVGAAPCVTSQRRPPRPTPPPRTRPACRPGATRWQPHRRCREIDSKRTCGRLTRAAGLVLEAVGCACLWE
jgi:hypothetical protein